MSGKEDMGSQNTIRKGVIEIKGMYCKSCAEKIETKLSQLKGVHEAKVSFVDEKAHIRFDPAQINLDAMRREIEGIGYEANIYKKGTVHEIWKKNSIERGVAKSSFIKKGIIYGLIPHTACMAYIVASVLGVTIAVELFKPLLLNPYFFHILILLSFIFATVSALIYLKKQGFITSHRTLFSKIIKRKWKYLSILYGATIGINLLLFMIIFPLLANVYSSSVAGSSGAITNENVASISLIKLKVDIPCPGHAPLIIQELKSLNGVIEAQFSFPNIFDVKYDSTKTSKQQILSLEVFKTYQATVLYESFT